MVESNTLTIVQTVAESPDSMTFYFAKPLLGKFKYQSGQFITLVVPINGEEHMRAYSLSSSPDIDKFYCITVKRVKGGLVSNHLLDNVKPGTQLKLKRPAGTFKTYARNSSARHVVLFGAGSGITPLFSMAKTVLAGEKQSKVSLIYVNRDEEHIIFKDYLDFLQGEFPDRFHVIHFLTQPSAEWLGRKGRLNSEIIKEVIPPLINRYVLKEEFYMCGPEGMMEEIEDGLLQIGKVDEQIFKENFSKSETKIIPGSQNLDYQARTVKLKLKRETHGLLVPANTTVLDAALENKIKIPFACGTGTCATCMCKVQEGDVEMVGSHCLSEKDIKKGYVLACKSYVKSSNVLLEVV